MKALIFFLTFSLTLIISSCSQVDQESSPLSPQMNKNINQSDVIGFPYNYLAEFPELESVKWEESLSDDEWIIVTMKKQSRDFHHIFCEIIYADNNEPVYKNSELFFAGKPDNFRFAFSKPTKTISQIKVYAVYDYPTANDIQTFNEVPQFPFNFGQNFNTIVVNSWDTKEKIISISAANDVNTSEYIFAQIDSKEGNKLVFAAKPSSEFFDIPKYGDTGVMDVNLFGFTSLGTFDVE